METIAVNECAGDSGNKLCGFPGTEEATNESFEIEVSSDSSPSNQECDDFNYETSSSVSGSDLSERSFVDERDCKEPEYAAIRSILEEMIGSIEAKEDGESRKLCQSFASTPAANESVSSATSDEGEAQDEDDEKEAIEEVAEVEDKKQETTTEAERSGAAADGTKERKDSEDVSDADSGKGSNGGLSSGRSTEREDSSGTEDSGCAVSPPPEAQKDLSYMMPDYSPDLAEPLESFRTNQGLVNLDDLYPCTTERPCLLDRLLYQERLTLLASSQEDYNNLMGNVQAQTQAVVTALAKQGY